MTGTRFPGPRTDVLTTKVPPALGDRLRHLAQEGGLTLSTLLCNLAHDAISEGQRVS